MKALRTIISILAVAAVSGGALLAAQPAAAANESETQTTDMVFTYDAVRAAEHGYEVRTDNEGFEYAVPVGTPTGSMEGATPKAPASSGPGLAALDHKTDTVEGNCGTATWTFDSKTHFTTSYNIFPQFGFALNHVWNVAITSSIDAESFNLDGAAPLASQSWSAGRDFDVQAFSGQLLSGTAGGNTVTVLGECRSLNPAASIEY